MIPSVKKMIFNWICDERYGQTERERDRMVGNPYKGDDVRLCLEG